MRSPSEPGRGRNRPGFQRETENLWGVYLKRFLSRDWLVSSWGLVAPKSRGRAGRSETPAGADGTVRRQNLLLLRETLVFTLRAFQPIQ